ncbi:low affinity immunoglobulin gamma Fc region receptor II-c-like isoform X2 [Anoplopoma fimbria]|uniref:low affinity immunoglobulin gamma Fc region receptor II-c-like isoform X2 n=1 Tax=Anoplopoma fimbria TaxID=229290 RepID=UPI0023ED5730|nr:low affinity immunoglobulin gamma Fc region receptor II-c-like isoform X2 [Anoplopoma fimbria]
MEVTALCIRLMRTGMLLLVAQAAFSYSQKADAAFPQVVPNRQQHFEYDPLVISCEGLEGWKLIRRIKGVVKSCSTSWSTSGPCEIKSTISAVDSGEYWCEMGVKTSYTVNITVTGGPVILESPVLPVMEGEAATLSCRDKQESPNLTAEFFKDGHLMERSSTVNMTIHRVTKSYEGVYKCRISNGGESPESWLTVRAGEEPHHGLDLLRLLCIGVGVFLVALLLLLGLLKCCKRPTVTRDTPTSPSSFQSSSSPQTVNEEASVAAPIETTYAVVTRVDKEPGGSSHCTRIAGTNPLLTEEDPFYCTID